MGRMSCFPHKMNTDFPACIARKVKIMLILHYYTETVCSVDVSVLYDGRADL